MNIKEELAQKKSLLVFESIQEQKSKRKKEIIERLNFNGQVGSSVHAREIINLELDSLKKLLHSKLKIDKDVFFKDSKPNTNEDENFIKKRLNDLYSARLSVNIESLNEYFKQYGLPSMVDYFNQECSKVLYEIFRKIEIEILENRISSDKGLKRDSDSFEEIEERRHQFLRELYKLSNGDENEILDMWKIGEMLRFSNNLTNKIGRYLK
jgi:hypothetical protein